MAPRTAVAAVSAVVVLCLAFAAEEGPQAWERSLASAVVRPDAIGAPMWVVMQAGTRTAILLTALALVVARRPRGAVGTGLAGALAWLVAVVAKEVVERPRPTAALVGRPLRDHVDGFGFPSSHAAIAAALGAALIVWLRPPVWTSALLALLTVGVALARVYFGVHWPLDVVGGIAVGVFASSVAAIAVDR